MYTTLNGCHNQAKEHIHCSSSHNQTLEKTKYQTGKN